MRLPIRADFREFVVVLGAFAVVALGLGAGSASAVESPPDPPTNPPGVPGVVQPAPLTVVMFSDGLRLRGGPGAHEPVWGQLYESDTLTVTECQGNWAHVRLEGRSAGGLRDGTVGWSASRYVLPAPVPEISRALPPGC